MTPDGHDALSAVNVCHSTPVLATKKGDKTNKTAADKTIEHVIRQLRKTKQDNSGKYQISYDRMMLSPPPLPQTACATSPSEFPAIIYKYVYMNCLALT